MRIKISHNNIRYCFNVAWLPIKIMMENDGISETEIDYENNNLHFTPEDLVRT